MKPIKKKRGEALLSFQDVYDMRRAIFAGHQRRLKEANAKRELQAARQVSISSSQAELMSASAPESEPSGTHGGAK